MNKSNAERAQQDFSLTEFSTHVTESQLGKFYDFPDGSFLVIRGSGFSQVNVMCEVLRIIESAANSIKKLGVEPLVATYKASGCEGDVLMLEVGLTWTDHKVAEGDETSWVGQFIPNAVNAAPFSKSWFAGKLVDGRVGYSTREAMLRAARKTLQAHAEGRELHMGAGSCPDVLEGYDKRDDECPVCQALMAVEAE